MDTKGGVKEALKNWNYRSKKATPYNIAKLIGKSESAVVKALRELREKNIVIQSQCKSWYLIGNEEITIVIPESVYNTIDARAVKEGLTFNQYLKKYIVTEFS